MNIVIRNYLSGSFLLEREPMSWDAIIILDPGVAHSNFVAKHTRRHLYLRFDDVNSEGSGKRAPTVNDSQRAIEFAATTQDLLVCCRAGQSRSAATAFLICHQHSGRHAALNLLDPRRHIPNSLIIELGARVFDDHSVRKSFNEWQVANRHIKLSDHLDKIEREFDDLEIQGARNRIVIE